MIFLIYLCLCLGYSAEAQSLICESFIDACPGTLVTLCTCRIASPALSWTLPGGRHISFGNEDTVGTAISMGAYTAFITSDIMDRESVLTYHASNILVNGIIECEDQVGNDPPQSPSVVSVAFAGNGSIDCAIIILVCYACIRTS